MAKTLYKTKIGPIEISDNGKAITEIYFTKSRTKDIDLNESVLSRWAIKEIQEYLGGDRREFTFPIEPSGTVFQKKVWEALRDIPYGQTRTYKDIAVEIGNPKAARAVGGANNKNPILIVIPCHRVIGASSKLVGYAAGLEIKEKLLEIEKL